MTRVSTLVTVILNMLALDTSTPINCQVRIISLSSSYARADAKCFGKVMDYISTRKPTLLDEGQLLRDRLQISGYLAIGGASLLIVLRM